MTAPTANPAGHPPAVTARPTTAQIEAVLREAFAPTRLEVVDDSHLHAGHAGAREGGHYTVRIRSSRFAGLNRVARHRLIYHALSKWMPRGIHALAVDADVGDPA